MGDGSGVINYSEFCEILEQPEGPMMQRMFAVFDRDGSGEIELKEFMVGLSSYTNSTGEEKLKFAFMMFDEDQNGFLEREELMKILRSNFPDLPPEALDRRADSVYQS